MYTYIYIHYVVSAPLGFIKQQPSVFLPSPCPLSMASAYPIALESFQSNKKHQTTLQNISSCHSNAVPLSRVPTWLTAQESLLRTLNEGAGRYWDLKSAQFLERFVEVDASSGHIGPPACLHKFFEGHSPAISRSCASSADRIRLQVKTLQPQMLYNILPQLSKCTHIET